MIIIKTLARIFKELGYIEQWGTGMRKIYEYSQSAGLKTPEISEKGRFYSLFFLGRLIFQKSQTPINTDKTQLQKKEPQEIVIAYLNRNNSITNKKARELTGLTADGVKSLFRRMLEQNLLVKKGEKRGTYYCLKK